MDIQASVRFSLLIFTFLIVSFIRFEAAHAASAGCLAVRGGALTVTGSDLDYNGDFYEAGETIVWTFTVGGDTATVTPPGVALAVTGGTSTFTFTTSGTYDIHEDVGGTVTASCEETTTEKQTAVQAAVKTLTDMQLVQSQAFQGQLLQELANAFLASTAGTLLTREVEGVISNLEARQAFLAQQAQNITNANQNRTGQLTSEKNLIESQLQSLTGQIDQEVTRRNKAQAAINLIDKKVRDSNTITALERYIRQKKRTMGNRERNWARPANQTTDRREVNRRAQELRTLKADIAAAELHRNSFPSEAHYYWDVKPRRELAIARATELGNLTSANTQISALQGRRDTAVQILSVKNKNLADLQARPAALAAEINNISGEIARIRSQISGVQTRIGQTPATQYAGTAMQGSSGFASAFTPVYGANPLKVSYSGGNQLGFFVDLNSVRKNRSGKGPRFADETGEAGAQDPGFNIWASGNYSQFESDQSGADRKGKAYAFATGAYHAPTARFMFGAMYRFRHSESESVAQSSDIETKGHGVGIHSTFVITPQLSFSAQALYERNHNSLIRSGVTGSYGANQYVASGSLQGLIRRGTLWMRPALGLTYAYVDSDAFTDSAGTLNAGQITEQAQVTFGSSVGFRRTVDSDIIKSIEPSFSATGVWSLNNSGDTTLASGSIIKQDDISFQFSAALAIFLHNETQISLNAGYSGLGASQVESYSIGGKITIPLGR